jgi:5,10-methenyltetrahydromethanopterin hydrogenase
MGKITGLQKVCRNTNITGSQKIVIMNETVRNFAQMPTCLGVKEVIYRDIEHDTYGIMVSFLQSFMVLQKIVIMNEIVHQF